MKILTTLQTREADAYTIAHEPISSVNLMERAAEKLAISLRRIVEPGTPLVFFCGNGNNGGDGLAMARLLEGSYPCTVYAIESSQYSPDFLVNWERLLDRVGMTVAHITSWKDVEVPAPAAVIIDALFGSGLSRPLSGFPAQIVDEINRLPCRVISIDVPSGLYGEGNMDSMGKSVVEADITLTLQQPKLSFFFPENYRYTGEYEVVNIMLHPQFLAEVETPYIMMEKAGVASWLKTRNKFAHKGNMGHAWIIAGEKGKCGAAILSSHACLRSGTGLLTSVIPEYCAEPMHAALPETMVFASGDTELAALMPKSTPSAIGMGPGIGQGSGAATLLKLLLQESPAPLVLDADALNILAENPTWLAFMPPYTILTPHPGEFDRLTTRHNSGEERFRTLLEFCARFQCITVLKGAHSVIAFPDGKAVFNSTGHPGMATGGSGDVLTGIITGLLAQGYERGVAACLGVYLHGLAAEFALQNESEESMIAGDIIASLGKAFIDLHSCQKAR